MASSGPPIKRLRQQMLTFDSSKSTSGIKSSTCQRIDTTPGNTPASLLSQFPFTAFLVQTVFDPKKDGNCQFSAVCHQLERHGVSITSSSDLRKTTVHYLMTNPIMDGDVLALDNGLQCTWNSYLDKLSVDGTYGDHVTLLAMARMYNVQILVLSSAGLAHTRLISPDDCFIPEKQLLILGHYPEGRGEHYVSLHCEDFSDPLIVSRLLSTNTQDQVTAGSSQISSTWTLENSSLKSSVCSTLTGSELAFSTATLMPEKQPDSSGKSSGDTFDFSSAPASHSVPTDLGKDQPSQPVLRDYPVSQFGKLKRKFQSSWYNGRSWLEYSIVRDACFCYACRLFAANEMNRDRDPAFISKGFTKWKTALEEGRGLLQHAASRGHIAAMAKWCEFKVRSNSGKTIEHQLSGEQLLRNRYYVKSLAEVVQFLAVNELSFRGDNEIESIHDGEADCNFGGLFLNLFKYTLTKDAKLREISLSIPKNAKYTSPDIQNEIISSMASAVQKKIVHDFEQSDIGKFCLKCDETRDISNVENMSLVLRFVKDGLPREHLLSVVELGDVDARAISQSICDELRNHGISIKSILTQCYDGASVMSGAKGGVRKFIEDEVGRPVPYIHCFNHQLHLAIVHAMQKEPKARNFFAICEHLYIFLRRQLPSNVYEGTTVKRLLEQRWTGHLESANIVLLNRKSIIEALAIVTESPKASSELSVEAAGLKVKVSQPQFAAIGEIVVKILSILKPANNMLQGKSCTMTDAMTIIHAAIESLQELRCDDAAFEQILIKSEMSVSDLASSSSASSDTTTNAADSNLNSYSGDVGTRPKRIKTHNTKLQSFIVLSTLGQDDSEVRPSTHVGLKQVMFALLDDVIGEMKARFNERNVELVNAVAALLPKSSSFLDPTALHPLVQLLELDSSQIEGELPVLKRVITNKVALESNLEDVFKVVLQFKDAFPQVHRLYVGGITIGVSTASCENSFSTLARVLRPHRKSMTHARKASLVLLGYEKKLCREIDMDGLLDIFRLRSRRILF